MKQTKNYPKVVEQIHNEFYSAGEELLKEALLVINNNETLIDKAERLENIGFKNSLEVKKASVIRLPKVVADLVQYYQQKYPFNKFITEDQVKKICNKYKLVCAPIENYKGFVPENKLNQIENFGLDASDNEVDLIEITKAWNTGVKFGDFLNRNRGANHIHRELGLKLIPSNHPALYWQRGGLFSVTHGSIDTGYVEKYKVYNRTKMVICAPKKDMELNGLERVGLFFLSGITVTAPDPVVLQPVKGGYLIVAAWGDEASDEIVVNTINN